MLAGISLTVFDDGVDNDHRLPLTVLTFRLLLSLGGVVMEFSQ